jgi:uncharacterized membrane protein YfcA
MLMIFNTVLIIIIGLFFGIMMGMTGILPIGLLILVLKYLNVGDYKTILGTVLYVILFPITIGSVWDFYNARKINYFVANVLLVTLIIGSFLGSKFVLDERIQLSEKTIKYISAVITLIASILFFISAYKL